MIAQHHLSIWTVYDHPSDFPNNYVARRFDGETPTGDIMVCPELEQIREQLRSLGLVQIARMDGDDPKILETWI